MPDSKLSALSQGLINTLSYGLDGSNASTKFQGTRILNVKDYGAVGDGVANDTVAIQNCLNAAFGSSSSPHGLSTNLNYSVYFPIGTYLVSGNPALSVTNVTGGLIYGGGMFGSVVTTADSSGTLFFLNGFAYSCIRDMRFSNLTTGGETVIVDYDSNASRGSQNTSFINCGFDCSSTTANSVCVRAGNSGVNQVDTTTFMNCWFAANGYGLRPINQNCLDFSIFGGQMQGGTATTALIYDHVGCVTCIHGVFFAQPNDATGVDILVVGGATEGYSITACRSESTNFFQSAGMDNAYHINACNHAGRGVAGHFVQGGGNIKLTECWSAVGDVTTGSGGSGAAIINMEGCSFIRFDALNLGAVNAVAYVKNCVFGDTRTAIGRNIVRQNTTLQAVRTFDIETSDGSTVSTDGRFLYDNYLDPTSQNNFNINGTANTGGSVVFSSASPTVVTFPQAPHFQGGEPLAFTLVSSAGTMPTGVSSGITYFATKDTLTSSFASSPGLTCHLSNNSSSALAGTANVNVTVGSTSAFNVWSVRKYAIGDQVLNVGVIASSTPGWICTTAGWAAPTNAPEVQAVFKRLASVGP